MSICRSSYPDYLGFLQHEAHTLSNPDYPVFLLVHRLSNPDYLFVHKCSNPDYLRFVLVQRLSIPDCPGFLVHVVVNIWKF